MSSPHLTKIIFSHPRPSYLYHLKLTNMMGQLNIDEIENLLQTAVIGRIGCSDGNLIYVVPISFVYDGSFVYGYSHEGFKTAVLRKNPTVCFEVEGLENLANWQTVIAHGTFEELTDPVLRLDALFKLNARKLPFHTSQTTRLTAEWPFGSDALSQLKGVAFRIRLQRKTGRFEKAGLLTETFF